MKQEIGTAIITCDENGTIQQAEFKPTMQLKDSTELVKALTQMDAVEEEKAQLVFASWMNEVNEIDMADREEKKVVVTNMGTLPHPITKGLKQTSFLFTFEDI